MFPYVSRLDRIPNLCQCHGLIPERDSPRDQLVVTLFLLTVFGLLLSAGIRSRMLKAGLDTNLLRSSGRRWWEVRSFLLVVPSRLTALQTWLPRRLPEDFNLGEWRSTGEYSAPSARGRNEGGSDYVPLSTSGTP